MTVDEQDACKTDDVVGPFIHSFGHTLIQGPIDITREVVNTVCDKKVIPKVEFVKPPERSSYGSNSWTAQQIGKGAGFFGMLLLLSRIVRPR
jgi:hypothetical protein